MAMAGSARTGSRRRAESNYLNLRQETSLSYLGAFPDDDSRIGVFELLQAKFGFQLSSVENQKEHFACYITNTELRLEAEGEDTRGALTHVHEKLFKNYKKWCNFLHVPAELADEQYEGKEPVEQQIALFLCIWGEAANLRFMPECICFLYHSMAPKLRQLSALPNVPTGWYLQRVVRPLYEVIETMKTMSDPVKGKKPLDHKDLVNYDDINEFFWTKACLRFNELNVASALTVKDNKTFREKRSVFNPLLAFFRVWFFLVVMFHTLVVIAYVAHQSQPRSTSGFAFYSNFFAADLIDLRAHAIYSIFITISGLLLLKVVLQMWLFGMRMFRDCWFAFGVFVRMWWHGIFLALFVLVNVSPSNKFFISRVGGTMDVGAGEKDSYLAAGAFLALVYSIPVGLASLVRMCCIQGIAGVRFLSALDGTMDQYVGRDVAQSCRFFTIYGLSWIVIFGFKCLFCLQFMIKPLIIPTVEIYHLGGSARDRAIGIVQTNHNIGYITALWAPVFFVFMYDTQIWFTLYQAIVGLFMGLRMKIGHMAGIKQFRNALRHAPMWYDNTITSDAAKSQRLFESGHRKFFNHETIRLRFAIVWNEIISSFRLNDLLDDKETMVLQYRVLSNGTKVEDPIFLIGGKVPKAIDIAAKASLYKWNGNELHKKLAEADVLDGVQNALHLVRNVMSMLLGDRAIEPAMRVIEVLFRVDDVTAVMDLTHLPQLADGIVELIATIVDIPEDIAVLEDGGSPEFEPYRLHYHAQVTRLVECVDNLCKTLELMLHDRPLIANLRLCEFARLSPDLAYQKERLLQLYKNDALSGGDVSFMSNTRKSRNSTFLSTTSDRYTNDDFITSCTRLYFLLRLETADSLPRSEEARRRLGFFLHSLTMEMPSVTSLCAMPSFSVMTPYYSETVLFTLDELRNPVHSNPLFEAVDERAVRKGGQVRTIIDYLISIHEEEWENFIERVGVTTVEQALAEVPLQVRLWASLRGQTLARTVIGMMMYENALRLLRWLEVANNPDFDEVGRADEMDRIAQLKFSYITGCQIYGAQRASNDHRADDIDLLMKMFPTWRVSYVDKVIDENGQLRFDAVLCKAEGPEIVEVYRYELPGNPILGEGKPENQNVALPFTRGQYIQTIDMNQEHYFEETLKMPNFLASATAYGEEATIIGMKEHVFTGGASSLARFMTMQELVFVSLTQRVLANPLRTRMHYGHPDVFEKTFVMTNGGVSKASKGINLSEDVFSGYNVTLRGGVVIHEEFMQCGKGRDVTLSQINAFEAKLSNGCAESCLSREGHRLGNSLDFFRLNSMFFGHFGFYICNALTVLCVYIYAYSKLYTATHEEVSTMAVATTKSMEALSDVINTQYILQFGFLTVLPLFSTLIVEFGMKVALLKSLELIGALGVVFYTFLTGTKAHFFDVALLRGGSKYRGTGRGFSITRDPMVNFFKEYGVSHFRKAFELLGVMILVGIYGNFSIGAGAVAEYCKTASFDCNENPELIPDSIHAAQGFADRGQNFGKTSFAVLLLCSCWLLAPFVFNTNGLDFKKTKLDIMQWFTWMMLAKNVDSVNEDNPKSAPSTTPKDGWIDWWNSDVDLMLNVGPMGRLTYLVRELRHFFAMYYVFTTHFELNDWPILLGAIVGVWFVLWVGAFVFSRVSSIKPDGLMILGIADMIVGLSAIVTGPWAIGVIVGWGWQKAVTLPISMLMGLNGVCQFGVALHGAFGYSIAKTPPIVSLGFLFDMMLGVALIVPLLILSFFPFMTILQTRLMYNGGFSRSITPRNEVPASLCILVGLLGGYVYGFMNCFVLGLSFVNDSKDFFINRSFWRYVTHSMSNFDKDTIDSLLQNGYLKVICAASAVVAVFLSMLLSSCLSRRSNMALGTIMMGVSLGLNFVPSGVIIVVSCGLAYAGGAFLVMNYMLYSFEICTPGWRGKGICMFLLGSAVGFLVNALLVNSGNKGHMSGTMNDWRYLPLYAVAPVMAAFLITMVVIPTSPIWLLRRGQDAAATIQLMRLRSLAKVEQAVNDTKGDLQPPTSGSNLGFRACFVFLLQAIQAFVVSNVMVMRIPLQTDDLEATADLRDASPWMVFYGASSCVGIVIGAVAIDKVRRKTLLKECAPFLSLLSLICGLLVAFHSGLDRFLRALLILAFTLANVSIVSVSWLSALEMFPLSVCPFFFGMSVAFYYVVQAALYLLAPSFAVVHLVFAGLCLLLTIVLFAFCASTKGKAIQLKSEKRWQLEQEHTAMLADSVANEERCREEEQQSRLAQMAQSQMSRRGLNPSTNSVVPGSGNSSALVYGLNVSKRGFTMSVNELNATIDPARPNFVDLSATMTSAKTAPPNLSNFEVHAANSHSVRASGFDFAVTGESAASSDLDDRSLESSSDASSAAHMFGLNSTMDSTTPYFDIPEFSDDDDDDNDSGSPRLSYLYSRSFPDSDTDGDDLSVTLRGSLLHFNPMMMMRSWTAALGLSLLAARQGSYVLAADAECASTCIGKVSESPYNYDPLDFEACKLKPSGKARVCCFQKATWGAPEYGDDVTYTNGTNPVIASGTWLKFQFNGADKVTYMTLKDGQSKIQTPTYKDKAAELVSDYFMICPQSAGSLIFRGWGNDSCASASAEQVVTVTKGSGDGTCGTKPPDAPKKTSGSNGAKTDADSITCDATRGKKVQKNGEYVCECVADWTGPPSCDQWPVWKWLITIAGGVAALFSIIISVRAFLQSRERKKNQDEVPVLGGPRMKDDEVETLHVTPNRRSSAAPVAQYNRDVDNNDQRVQKDREFTL
ncbi:TPA: hypothetical protein N0F65_003337 [Lagenidium giganteum]|uniref:1,3-beta-glucan synthase n=1 Tax=Lagenidium giganteum TaxID=4803 RepID=A0AAV2ZAZ2_9STRA|nr:TPA: hypothetical protein N0F65_003337 [Lagenidium giganteum]